MAYSRFVTPDQRLRRIEGQTRREVERKQELALFEQRRTQELQSQIEQEKVRGLELDRGQELNTQFETERARGLELDERATGITREMRAQRERDVRRVRPPVGEPTATPTPPLSPGAAEAARRQRELRAVTPIPAEPTGPSGPAIVQTRFLDPLAAAGLQIVESPAGTGIPGVGALKGAQRGLEEIGVPEELSPLPRERTFDEAFEGGFVNPITAALGNKEEQGKAQAVLEEAGLPRALAAQVIFDPLNLVPGIGFTKVPNAARLGRLALNAAKAAPEARAAAVRILRESDTFQQALRGIREQGELGAARLGSGEPVRDSVLGKLRIAGEQAPENWIENARLSSQEFGERATRAASLRDDLIKQGVSEQEAILKSTAELRGEMPFRGVTGLDFSPKEEAWFWDQILSNVQYAEGVNVADYMQQMMRRVATGESRDFPPFIWRILGRAFGEDFTGQLQVVVRERLKAVKTVAEESAAERLAKAPPPRGVTDKTPLPPEFGGEQLPIRRVPGAPEPGPARTTAEAQQFRTEIELGQASLPRRPAPIDPLAPGADLGEQVPLRRVPGAPEASPQRTFAEQQQFRAEIELEASPKPRGITPGEVADPTGAEQGILRDAAEQFPAPGVDLQGVQVAQRETFLDFLSNTVGVLKPLLSSMDISWFRQISKTIPRNSRAAFQSLRRGLTALWSQEKAVAWMDALRAEGSTTTGYRQLVRTEEGTREIALGTLLEDRYLAIPGTPGFGETSLTRRPEFFMSEFAQRVPGIRQSGRGFAVGWNTNYQGTMRYWLDKLTKMNGGVLTQKQVDAALNLGERLTGVGKLGSDNSWFVKALKVLGFAPGFRASGPEAFLTLISPRTDPLIRRMAAENILSWAAMGNGILTALKYGAGATVVTELGSSQFGRVKFPGSDTYYNIWGTDNVLARAVLQAITQQRIDVKGNISIVGSGEKTLSGFASSFADAALRYLKSGEAPAIGLFEELRTGETFIGKELAWDIESVGEVLKNRLPIVMQDFMDLLQTDGPLQTLFSAPGAVTGTTGITSYTPTRETFRTIPKYNSADKELVEGMLGRTIPEPLNLTANEERTLLRFLRVDVREWVEDLENKHGPIPSRISMEQVILKVAQEKGLSGREVTGAIFLHKAKSNTDALNKEWIKFLLKNRPALEDFYPATYDTDVIQAAQERAEELGLVPVR